MCKIVVIGSTNTDMAIQTEHLPGVGDIVAGGRFRLSAGGKGAIQAVAASRLGGSVSLITKTGNDLFGRQAKQMFAEEGIRTDYIFPDPNHSSGVALIMLNKAGDKYISLAQGGITTLSKAEIDKCRNELQEARVVLIELETPIETALYAARVARENNVPVIINPSPRQTLPDILYRLATIMAPNRTEARMMTGIEITDWDSAMEAAKIIEAKGVETTIITMGPIGALLYHKGVFERFPAVDVTVLDSSGAGDVFCAAICVALSERKSFTQAMNFANHAAALTITREGMMEAIPYRHEVETLLDGNGDY